MAPILAKSSFNRTFSLLSIIMAPHRAVFKLGGKKSFVYVAWLRMCQLSTVLTGVISKSLKKLAQT